MSRIDAIGVTKSFGDLVAVRDLSLSVDDGCFFVLVGPSGAGKTTTLRVVAGLERPDAGEVRYDGRPAGDAAPAARDVAMVFQNYALYPKQTARRNIASPLRARRVPAAEADRRVAEVAARLHIDHLLDRRPAQLSGGEQQRVALGRALVRRPRAFLLDEPLTNLDVKLRVEMRSELTRLHRSLGATFLYVTNDQVEAMSMGDRLAVLDRGVVQQVGTPAEVYGAPRNRFVATFIGSSRMNLLDCVADADVLVGDVGWRLPAPRGAPDGRRLQLGVRPEDVRLDPPGDEPALDGTVYAVEPLGDRCLVDVQVGDAIVRVKTPPTDDHRFGTPVRVAVDPRRTHLFDAETGAALGAQAAVSTA